MNSGPIFLDMAPRKISKWPRWGTVSLMDQSCPPFLPLLLIFGLRVFSLKFAICNLKSLYLGLPFSTSITPIRDGLLLHNEFDDLTGIFTFFADKIPGATIHIHNSKAFEL